MTARPKNTRPPRRPIATHKTYPAVRMEYTEDLDRKDGDIANLCQFREMMEFYNLEAENGYHDGARDRLSLIAAHLRAGFPMPPEDLRRLCDWLEAIAAGDDPATVLGLKKRTGPAPNMERLERLHAIAQSIWCIQGAGTADNPVPHTLHDSADGEGAFTIAARKHSVSEPEARLAWEVWGNSYSELIETGTQGLPNLKPLKRRKS